MGAVPGRITVAVGNVLAIAPFVETAVERQVLEIRREVALVWNVGQLLVDTRGPGCRYLSTIAGNTGDLFTCVAVGFGCPCPIVSSKFRNR